MPKTAVKPTRMLRSLDFCPVSGRSFHDLAIIPTFEDVLVYIRLFRLKVVLPKA